MAAAMSAALNNARLYERERLVADRLQEAMLALPNEIEGVEFAHAYRSASDTARVGGDFYDIFELDGHRVGVTIGDVAGKGLDAAVLTSLAKNAIRAHASERGKTPSQILALTNDVVHRATSAESFVTLFLGILDRRDGRLVYASAAHPAMVVRSGGVPEGLSATGTLLGAFEGSAFGETEVCLDRGEVLFLYTDGLTEARGDGELYGEARLMDALRVEGGGAYALVESVMTDVLIFSGGRLRDDLAILAVQRD
jgi:sigma-B regulation protein RsbU (phosphoserine phosphatase)